MTDERFAKHARLLRGAEFERVFAAKTSTADGQLVIHGATNELDRPRLGIAVSRSKGSAVVRNRWKRVIREVFRRLQHELPPLDLVCIPRPGAVPDFHRLVDSLPRLAARIEEKLRRSRPSAANRNPPGEVP
jgi:ribonuclease P protein component